MRDIVKILCQSNSVRHQFSLCTLLLALLLPSTLLTAGETSDTAVVATVGDDPLTLADVKRTMESLTGGRTLASEVLPIVQAQVLEENIKRWLVIAYARSAGDLPSDEQLAKEKKQLRMHLTAQGRKLSSAAEAGAISDTELERQALWRLLWDSYLDKYRTPQRRQTWFRQHHRDVDGTELVVSHILFQPTRKGDATQLAALSRRAADIRTEIIAGKLTFADAAAKYSAGPSAKEGGRLGRIGRQAPMDEAFSRAAFELEAGQISPPVRSAAGVHLIRCDEVVLGKKQVDDVKDIIDAALAKELLTKISDMQRDRSEVKYTGKWPHFKPGTQELAK
jgi:parvulin-like peptidyl-prolyl isomerase